MQTDCGMLVDVQEISGIMEHCTFEDILGAKKFDDEWLESVEQHKTDSKWNYYLLLTALYTAGKVQGKREIRQKKRKAKKQA